MRWNMEMLLSENFPEKVKEKLQRVYEDNQRMVMWVNDLLNVSRIEQGRLFDNPVDADVIALIQKIVDEQKPDAQKKLVSIDIEAPKDLPHMFVDPNRLHDVIQNIISNAVKYNVSGGKVVVRLVHTGDFIHISISDTGIGIPKADL